MKERDALSPDERHRLSTEIVNRLRGYLFEKKYQSIHCYISFRSEVETREFIEHALQERMRITVPIVEQIDGKKVLAHTEVSKVSGLADGHFGLQESVERTPASLLSLDAVIVPLVAFDRRGTRLGYGMGFYDTFLHELPRTIERIGFAFSLQEINHIPSLPHDEPLDTIITEKEIIHVNL
jgi:5-formyltetrahydrofolate cyclo-ligase